MEKITLLDRLLKGFSKQEGLEDFLRMTEHWDGYKRENAVRRLGKLGNPIAIPYLITRANDWVPQVRKAAKEAIVDLAIPQNGNAFILSLPELYHLANCGRDDHQGFISSIENYLINNTLSDLVVKGITNEKISVARACFLLSLSHHLLDERSLLRLGISHPDIVVRSNASHILKGLPAEEQEQWLTTAIQDKFMPIRREALQIFLSRGISIEFITHYLFDRHASIREIAIKHLLGKDIHVSNLYGAALRGTRGYKLKCAIWGIGYLQAKEYIDQIKMLLESDQPSIRKQSLSCLSRLIGEDFNPSIIKFLSDASPAVCKEAASLSAKNSIRFNADTLSSIAKESRFDHTLNACFGILKRTNKWESLIFLFDLLMHTNQLKNLERQQIDDALQQWDIAFNKNSVQPTANQSNALKGRCQTLRFDSNKGFYNNIIFTLKSLGIYGA